MMTMYINMMIILNFLLLKSNHPLLMGLIILTFTLLMSMTTSFFLSSSWFAYILILVFLGGMLIIFIYISSLASNEIMSHIYNYKSMVMVFLMILFISMNSVSLLLGNYFTEKTPISLNWMYSNNFIIPSSFLICYLFIVLVSVVKITKFWGGSIRNKNNYCQLI